MTADFFREKRLVFISALSALIVGLGVFYAGWIRGATSVEQNGAFYFLVSNEEHVQASAENAYLSGGAGYVLTGGENVCAAYACYFTESGAEQAQSNLAERGIRASVLRAGGATLYFKSEREKANAKHVKAAFNAAYTCARLLGDLADGAETGVYTQEALKELLWETNRAIGGLRAAALNCVPTLSAAFSDVYKKIEEIAGGIVFAKNIRYAQLCLCDGYLLAAREFSL